MMIRIVHTSTIWAVLAIVGGLNACGQKTEIEALIEFDGERRTISTTEVDCARHPGGTLVILVTDGPKHSVRIQLTQQGRITVHKVGLRYGELSGYVADPGQMSATKVDDTYTVVGRMPPKDAETQWHVFTVETTCPGYRDALRPDPVPDIPPIGR